MNSRRDALSRLAAWGAAALGATLSGCAAIVLAPEVEAMAQIDSASVLVVGRIELRPMLSSSREQVIHTSSLGGDPFGQAKHVRNRIVLSLGKQPSINDGASARMMNPELERTFFLRVPKDRPYIVFGRVFMTIDGRPDPAQLIIPVPLDLGVRADDRAVYIGTLRFDRDEFNSVTQMTVLDEKPAASNEARQRFGHDVMLRSSLARRISAART